MRITLLMLAVCVMGCDNEIPAEESFEESILPLFESSCIGCHNAALPEGGLDLQTDPYSVLLESPSNQSTLPFIQPGDHIQSYLWHKMNGSQAIAGGAGTNMPLGEALLEGLLDVKDS